MESYRVLWQEEDKAIQFKGSERLPKVTQLEGSAAKTWLRFWLQMFFTGHLCL